MIKKANLKVVYGGYGGYGNYGGYGSDYVEKYWSQQFKSLDIFWTFGGAGSSNNRWISLISVHLKWLPGGPASATFI